MGSRKVRMLQSEFDAITKCRSKVGAKCLAAAELVLVEGYTQKAASEKIGITPQELCRAIKRVKAEREMLHKAIMTFMDVKEPGDSVVIERINEQMIRVRPYAERT